LGYPSEQHFNPYIDRIKTLITSSAEESNVCKKILTRVVVMPVDLEL
jgi:hypothetical protein